MHWTAWWKRWKAGDSDGRGDHAIPPRHCLCRGSVPVLPGTAGRGPGALLVSRATLGAFPLRRRLQRLPGLEDVVLEASRQPGQRHAGADRPDARHDRSPGPPLRSRSGREGLHARYSRAARAADLLARERTCSLRAGSWRGRHGRGGVGAAERGDPRNDVRRSGRRFPGTAPVARRFLLARRADARPRVPADGRHARVEQVLGPVGERTRRPPFRGPGECDAAGRAGRPSAQPRAGRGDDHDVPDGWLRIHQQPVHQPCVCPRRASGGIYPAPDVPGIGAQLRRGGHALGRPRAGLRAQPHERRGIARCAGA